MLVRNDTPDNHVVNHVLVTILAFIYVPINLATSIFGMNIQQLNGNGQNLWVFFTTAVVALVITGGSWLCSNHFAKRKAEAVAWYKERAAAKRLNDKTEHESEHSLLLRMAMLVWLVRNGHKAWMWHSGAWLAILINSKAPRKKSPGFYLSRENSDLPACGYVSRYSKPGRYQDIRFLVKSGTANVTWSPLGSWG